MAAVYGCCLHEQVLIKAKHKQTKGCRQLGAGSLLFFTLFKQQLITIKLLPGNTVMRLRFA
jgi:hypothetical protein